MEYVLNAVGYDYKHNNQFRIERPFGSGDYLFLFFTTEVILHIGQEERIAKPNSCIIYTPSFPQLYYNKAGGLINDWFHFSGENVIEFFEKSELPLNTLFQINDFSFVRLFIKKLEKEFIRKDFLWEENVSALLKNFFITLAREYSYCKNYSQDPYKTDMLEKFKGAREVILTNLEEAWSIDEMASLVGLSRSRFSVLYKAFFQCSPKEDLIEARMSEAKYLLKSSKSLVKDVAQKVGYENVYHFNKQFKSIIGYPPGKYASLKTAHEEI